MKLVQIFSIFKIEDILVKIHSASAYMQIYIFP